MVGSDSVKTKNPINSSNPHVKPNPNILITRSPITLCEGKAMKPQVLQSTEIQSISKVLHLLFRSVQSSLFLLCQQYFIKVPQNHPWVITSLTQNSKQGPGVFLAGSVRVSVETCKLPGIINSMVYERINMPIRICLDIQRDIISPQQS